MATHDTDRVIDALLTARRTWQPVDAQPLARALLTADDAYLVQTAVANELGWFDTAPPTHWKSGAASATSTAAHSALPPAGVWASPAQAGSWPHRMGGIEAEVAFRLAVDVDAEHAAGLDVDGASALVDAMAVTIELVDSRWQQGFGAAPLLRLADVQCHAALVVGEWVPFVERDWLAQRCIVTIGAAPPVEFIGSHAAGNPAAVLADWLRHATADQQVVPAGTVVTAGTWCGLLTARPGELVHVRFEGIGEASVQL